MPAATAFANYTFYVAPARDGNVTVGVPAEVARDLAGNNNTAAAPHTVRSDRTPPVPRITSTQPATTGSATVDFRIGFNETVRHFDGTDIAVSGTADPGGVTGFARIDGGANYTFEVTAGPGAAPSGWGSPPAPPRTLRAAPTRRPPRSRYGTMPPAPARRSPRSRRRAPTNATAVTFNVTFDQDVTGFGAGDITLSGDARPGSAGNFARINATNYSFEAVPGRDGLILVDVGEGAAENRLGNPSTAADRFQIRSDRTAPVPRISTTQPDPTGSAVIDFRNRLQRGP